MQIFKTADVGKPCANPNGEAGKCGFVGEIIVAGPTGGGTVGTLEFSRDPKQTCLYLGDLTNFTIYVLNRSNLQEVNRVGTGGRQAGTLPLAARHEHGLGRQHLHRRGRHGRPRAEVPPLWRDWL